MTSGMRSTNIKIPIYLAVVQLSAMRTLSPEGRASQVPQPLRQGRVLNRGCERLVPGILALPAPLTERRQYTGRRQYPGRGLWRG